MLPRRAARANANTTEPVRHLRDVDDGVFRGVRRLPEERTLRSKGPRRCAPSPMQPYAVARYAVRDRRYFSYFSAPVVALWTQALATG
jgi:hypothetical protein